MFRVLAGFEPLRHLKERDYIDGGFEPFWIVRNENYDWLVILFS